MGDLLTLELDKKTDTVRTPRINELIRIPGELGKVFAQKETGQITVESVLSRCVP
jgi:hypothetical protein